jgi:REP element-mobilizing transposase RayT
VKVAIKQTCLKRQWQLHALNVRTNHAHTVVSIGGKKGSIALTAFKANATRQMREDGCWESNETPWVEKGSIRYLWNERSIDNAVYYVINGQGHDLPDFDK